MVAVNQPRPIPGATRVALLGPEAVPNGPSPADLDAQQRMVVEHRGGPLLVVGGPGTGKTTALVESAIAAAEPSGDLSRTLVLTYSRSAAQALRARLVRRSGRTQVGLKVMTVHGLCLSLVRRHLPEDDLRVPRLLTAPEQDFRIRELLAGHDTSGWPPDLAAAATTRGFASEVRALLSRMRQLGLDPDDVVRTGGDAGRSDWAAVGGFFDEYLDVLDAEGVLDYAELVHRTRLLLTDPAVRASLAVDVDRVLVDEYAELDRSQVRVLADLVACGLELVAFADPSTSVFGFRGADPRSVPEFAEVVTGGHPETATRIDLTTDHRSARRVHAATSLVAARLPGPSVSLPSDAARPEAGRVDVVVLDSEGAQAEFLARVLRTAHREQGWAWHDMAVITRVGRGSIPAISRALTGHGIPVEVAGDEVALAEEAAVRPLVAALEAVVALADGVPLDADQVAALLRSPLGGLDGLALRRLGRQLRAARRAEHGAEAVTVESSWQLITGVVNGASLGEAVADHTPEARAAAELGRLLGRVAGAVAGGGGPGPALWQLWSGTSWPDRLAGEAMAPGEGNRRANRDLDAVCALFDLVARAEHHTGAQAVRGFLAEVRGQQIPADTTRETSVTGRGVRVLTAHRAKGQEWKLVAVAGVQEGRWPASRQPGTVLEPERLTTHGMVEPDPWRTGLATERRLFLLATSRASDHLVVTAVNGVEGEADQPSRFVTELGVASQHVSGRPAPSGTAAALTAELRRVLDDPESHPALRSAAAARLARLADARTARGRPVSLGADPRTWWGVLDYTSPGTPPDPAGRLQVSGSVLESVRSCPRQWFLSRKARANVSTSGAQSLGTVIHVLAQHAASDGLTIDTLSTHLDQVWDQIPFDATWLSASERVEAEAALERFCAWHETFSAREVLGVEVQFNQPVQVGGEEILLTGTVDRLELDTEGRLRIVDFKTGRHVPTAAQARESDQLGLYQLAASEGAFDRLTGGVREIAGAELVFVRAQDGQSPWPKILSQPSIHDQPDPDGDHPTWVHAHLAEAMSVMRAGDFPAQPCDRCSFCVFAASCPAQAKAPEVV